MTTKKLRSTAATNFDKMYSKKKKKLTLVNQDCLIPTASFLKLDSHSRVSPTHTHIVLLGSRP